jgi:TonB-linked SusC/RagA family outer membrane protein
MRMKKVSILIIALVSPFLLLAQQHTVSGNVTDAASHPLPGVTVLVKGGTVGTTTNTGGHYEISAQPGDVLEFRFLGYINKDVTVTDATSLNVTLASNQQELSAVVVTALGITRQKRTIGFSSQEISGSELVQSHQPNLVNALQGRVAGVTVTSSGGGPGQGASILIRGVNSLDVNSPGVNEPLFVIDGIPMDNSTSDQGTTGGRGAQMPNRASDINPEDIESINILRGGAATALYGLRGANGVVVITTKQAKAGTMRVNYTATYGIDQVDKFPEVQNKYTQGYSGVYDKTSFWPEWGPTVAAAKGLDPTHPDQLYNQYARAYINGNQFRNTLSVSGGTEKASLASSVSYFKQNGTIPFTWYRDLSAKMSGKLKISDKLSMGAMMYYINTDGNFYDANRFNEDMSYWSPRWDVRDYIKPDGTEKTYGNDNPWYTAATNKFESKVNRIISSVNLTYSPLSWLTASYRFGMDYYMDARTATAPGPKGVPDEFIESDNGEGFVNEFRHAYRQVNSNLMLSFDHKWNDKFQTTLHLGQEVLDRNEDMIAALGSDLNVYNLFNLGNAAIQQTAQDKTQYRIVSVYGEFTAGYDDYLYLTLTGRNDWTSSLEQANRSFFYPSVSLSYIFSDQVKLPSWVTYAKLRASLAEIGKDARPYSTAIVYVPAQLPINQVSLWTRNNASGVSNLKPERTTTFEIGTDLSILQDRLGLNFTWYKSDSKDEIIGVQTPASTGFTTITLNAGEIRNRGVELTVHATPVKKRNFSWDLSLNFSANKNRVVAIYKDLQELVVGSEFGYGGSSPTFKYIVGQPVGNIYGTYWQRYYGNGKTGDSLFTDKSKPQVIGADGFPVRAPSSDQKILGNSQPKWLAGLNNSFTYKNWNLSFLFDTRQGLEKFNQLDNFMSAFGIAKYTENRDETIVFPGVLADGTPNTKKVWLNQGTGPDGVDYGAGYYRNVYRGVTENFVQDASWVRLRTVSLSYNLPERWLKGSFISRASVSFTGNNLWLSTPYNGFDPEASDAPAGSAIASEQSGFTYPQMRNYLFSVNVTF